MKQFASVLFFILSLNSAVFSQQKKVDSLENAVKTLKDGPQRFEAAAMLARYYSTYDIKKGSSFLQKAKEIGSKSTSEFGNASLIYATGILCWQTSKYDSALILFGKAQHEFERLNRPKDLAQVKNSQGLVYWNLSKYDLAIEKYKEALLFFQKDKNNIGISVCYTNIGLVYGEWGAVDSSLSFHYKALKLNEQTDDFQHSIISLTNIAQEYVSIGRLDEGKVFTIRAASTAEKINDKQAIADSYGTLGNIYDQKKQMDSSLICYTKALTINRELHNSRDEAILLCNIGIQLKDRGKPQDALNYLSQALNIHKINKEEFQVCVVYRRLAEAYLSLNQIHKALNYADTAKTIATKLRSIDELYQISKSQSSAYEQLGDFKTALTIKKQAEILNDSLFNQSREQKINQLYFRYEAQRRELENTNLIIENKLISTRQRYTVGIFSSIMLILLLFIIYFRDKVTLLKNRSLIRLQNQIKEEAQDLIGRELHNDYATSLALLISVSKSKPDFNPKDQFYTTLKDVHDGIKSISSKLTKLDFHAVTLNEKFAKFFRDTTEMNSIEFDTHIQEDCWVNIKHDLQYEFWLIIKELVTNTIKHSGATVIVINLFRDKKNITLIFENNGIPIDINLINKGQGISNLTKVVKAYGGTCFIDTQISNGFIFNAKIPVKNNLDDLGYQNTFFAKLFLNQNK